jgi:hypothetical protein
VINIHHSLEYGTGLEMAIKIHPAPPIAFPCHSIFLFPPSILVFVVPAV